MRLLLILLLIAFGAHAKTATLQGSTTNTCAFSDTLVGAGGDLTVTCVTAPQPPAPPSSCPAFSGRVRSLGSAGTAVGNEVQGPPGNVAVFALPAAGFGVLGLYPTPYTVKAGPAVTEIKVSKCRGDFTDSGDGCYVASAAIDGGQINQYWAVRYTTRYPDAASFVKAHRCLIDTGTWFLNVRLKEYPAGTACGNACGWVAVWHLAS